MGSSELLLSRVSQSLFYAVYSCTWSDYSLPALKYAQYFTMFHLSGLPVSVLVAFAIMIVILIVRPTHWQSEHRNYTLSYFWWSSFIIVWVFFVTRKAAYLDVRIVTVIWEELLVLSVMMRQDSVPADLESRAELVISMFLFNIWNGYGACWTQRLRIWWLNLCSYFQCLLFFDDRVLKSFGIHPLPFWIAKTSTTGSKLRPIWPAKIDNVFKDNLHLYITCIFFCLRPIANHYFPTLHQMKYELEDGFVPISEGDDPEDAAVRFGFEDTEFPEFSWRGYAVFSRIQPEVWINILFSFVPWNKFLILGQK